MNQWQIVDDSGVIHSGPQDEIILLWDLLTRTITDLACEYRRTYTKKQLQALYNTNWLNANIKGDVKLIEIHKIHK